MEVTLENAAKTIYHLPSVHKFVNSTLSPLNLRRARAACHVVCTAWGIFSIFYFLGGANVGNVFVDRLVIAEGLRLKAPLPYLIILGYFYAQCCMQVEAWMGRI